MLLREVEIDGGLFEVAMTEQDLDGAEIRSSLQQMGRKAVPQGVRMDMLMLETSTQCGLLTRCPSTLVVTGWFDVCHLLPGNSQRVGLRRSPRQ